MISDPSLLDHLLTVLPEQDAQQVHLWVQHPWAVRYLMDGWGPYDNDYGSGCSSCLADLDGDHDTHSRPCKWIEALDAIKHPKLEQVMLHMRDCAQQLMNLELENRRERHFADATTQELQYESQFTDSYGRYMEPPEEDY